jgi:hypothetical protein
VSSVPIEPPEDDRAERMVADPSRYFPDAWERTEAEVVAERTARPASGRFRRKRYPRPTPGVVQLSARGVSMQDLERLLERMKAGGFQVWPGYPKTHEHDDGVLCVYFSVEVPEDAE